MDLNLDKISLYIRERDVVQRSQRIDGQNESMKQMRDEIVIWINDTIESIKCLRELADEIESVFKSTSKAKIGGSAASIAGGIVSVVGFDLSFVTFGTSMILFIVGGAVAGAGGFTTGTASIVNSIKSSSRCKAAEEAVRKYNEQSNKIKERCIEISKRTRNIDDLIPEWVLFWGTLIGCGYDAGWSVVGKSIVNSLKLSRGLAGDAASAGKSVFRAAGTAARVAHIAGGVVGIIFLPLDIHTLVNSALDVGKRNIPNSAKEIRRVAKEMENGCPTVEAVDKMIKQTIHRLEAI